MGVAKSRTELPPYRAHKGMGPSISNKGNGPSISNKREWGLAYLTKEISSSS